MMPDQGVAVQKVGELEIKSVYHFFHRCCLHWIFGTPVKVC